MSNWKEMIGDQEVLEEEAVETFERPPMYNVMLLNDDYTPMDFVIDVLRRFFNKTEEQATDIMLDVHYKGKARCGTYTAEVAETKVSQVCNFAIEHQHPLKCMMEKA